MNIVNFFLDVNCGDYSSRGASTLEMNILGDFLSSDVGFYSAPSFKKYAFNNTQKYTNSNITALKKENGYIFLSDLYSEEDSPVSLKLSHDQFIKLLDDWQETVCKSKPKEVILKYENDQYIFETKD